MYVLRSGRARTIRERAYSTVAKIICDVKMMMTRSEHARAYLATNKVHLEELLADMRNAGFSSKRVGVKLRHGAQTL